MTDPSTWDDEMLLAMLRVLFDDVDPVPDDVVAAARAVFTLRSACAPGRAGTERVTTSPGRLTPSPGR